MHLGRVRNFIVAIGGTLLFCGATPTFAQDNLADDDIFALDVEETAETPPPPVVEEPASDQDVSAAEEQPEAEAVVEKQISEPTEPAATEELAVEPVDSKLSYPEGVEVETSAYSNTAKRCDCEYTYLTPYATRRGTLGFLMSVGYSTYAPDNYKPDFVVNETFKSFYGVAETPLVELTLGLKWNISLGALILETGAGHYTNQGLFESKLQVIPIRGGLTYAMDNLFSEPFVVPYATLGAYKMFYEESLASQSVRGSTDPSLYYGAGLAFQLNWLDEVAANASYDEMGLENTFLFLEARSFLGGGSVPDFGSGPQFGAGLKLEY